MTGAKRTIEALLLVFDAAGGAQGAGMAGSQLQQRLPSLRDPPDPQVAPVRLRAGRGPRPGEARYQSDLRYLEHYGSDRIGAETIVEMALGWAREEQGRQHTARSSRCSPTGGGAIHAGSLPLVVRTRDGDR